MSDGYLVGTGESDFDTFPDESDRSLFQIAYENGYAASGYAVRQAASGSWAVGRIAIDVETER